MTPKELKEIAEKKAMELAQPTFEIIVNQMEQAAQHGVMSVDFRPLPDAVVKLLEEAGYKVERHTKYTRDVFRMHEIRYHTVSLG